MIKFLIIVAVMLIILAAATSLVGGILGTDGGNGNIFTYQLYVRFSRKWQTAVYHVLIWGIVGAFLEICTQLMTIVFPTWGWKVWLLIPVEFGALILLTMLMSIVLMAVLSLILSFFKNK